MALSPLAVHDLTEALLGCVCAALQDAADKVEGAGGCPCRSCVVPGTPAWDSCEDPCGPSEGAGGQLTVNLARMYPSSDQDFPSESRPVQGVRGCMPAPVTAVELVVTLLRCAPGPSEDGCPPDCAELSEAARRLSVDAVTVYNAMLCCLPGTSTRRRGQRFVVGQQRTIGPEGLCVGIEQRVTVALPGCGCPEESV